MKNISFENAPVVELIAELRWAPPGAGPHEPGQVTIAVGGEVEKLFRAFGREVAKSEYTQAERIFPASFPAILHQVVWRFRKLGDNSTLLQVGPGLFSANALQPYQSWQQFRPTVELGVSALLATRIKAEKAQPFSGVSLRYMNAFTGDLLAGKSPEVFIKEVLGVELSLPNAFDQLVDLRRKVSLSTNLLIPIANTSKIMSLAIGDGEVNSEPAAMYDVTVAEKSPVESSADAVMHSLDTSRDIIHQCFLGLTENVKHLLKPQDVNRAG